jgi:hypothetical protein
MLLGNDGGVWLSDPGVLGSWQNLNAGLSTSQIYKGAVDPTGQSHLTLAGIQDNGTAQYSGDQVWRWVQDGDGGDCAISSSEPAKNWAVSYEPFPPVLDQFRTLNGALAGPSDFSNSYNGIDSGLLDYYLQFLIHFEKSPKNDDLFIAGTTRLFRCNNFFSGTVPQWHQNSPIMYNGTSPVPISALAFAPSDTTGFIYAFGTEDGQLRITGNGGTSWNDLDSVHGVPDRYISGLAFSPSDPNVLYVSLSGFDEATPQAGHLFKTSNALAGSPTWVKIGPNVNLPHNCLAIDPNDDQKIYVGTDIGVWVSSDGGGSWSHYGPSSGMPNVAVFDLRINALSQVTAFTHGRGAYLLNYYINQTIIEEALCKSPCLRLCPSCPEEDFWANIGDPVEFELPLRNILPIDTVNLTVTMLPSAQIEPLIGTQQYGVVTGLGAVVSRSFVFRANGVTNAFGRTLGSACGDTVQVVFQLQDQGSDLGRISVPFRLGLPNHPLVEDFEQTQVPFLPPGWSTTNLALAQAWTTTTNQPPNSVHDAEEEDVFSDFGGPTNTCVFTPADTISQTFLTSAPFTISTPRAQLYFRQAFSISNSTDGGILEIAIGNQPFQEVLLAGCSFAQDGYNAMLTNSNPLGSRAAWSGDSGGWLPVLMNLPVGAVGQQVRLRWHLSVSQGLPDGFWFVDTVLLTEPLCSNASFSPPAPFPGCSLTFDGIDDLVQIGSAPLPAPWTAEFWVNRQQAFDNSAVLLGDIATALKLEQYPNTRQVGFTQFGVADYSFNYVAPTGTWVHLAFVATTNTQLFVNGVLQDTYPATVALPLGQLGNDFPNRYTNHFRGQMDEVRLWTVARSQEEIQATMNRSLAGSEVGLAAYWPMNECGGPVIHDATGAPSHTGALSNGVTWAGSTIPFAPNAITLSASSISASNATLNGSVNPNGAPTTYWFEWGISEVYTNRTPPISVGGAYTNSAVSNVLSSVQSGSTYRFRLVATNNSGRSDGFEDRFVLPIPRTRTNLVQSVAGATMTLSWPATYTGWLLQVQTNNLSIGLGNNWVNVPGSATNYSMTFPMNPDNLAIFYRLFLP